MHIYQPFDLILGVFMLPLGLLGLGQAICRALTRTFRNSDADWRSLGLSLWFVSDAPAHLSRAFDPAHQESARTGALEEVAISGFAVILVAWCFAWVARRRRKAEAAGAGAVHPAV